MGNTRLVMVVDDDEDILETYAMLLQSAGYEVLTAPNGKVALERLREGSRPSRADADNLSVRWTRGSSAGVR